MYHFEYKLWRLEVVVNMETMKSFIWKNTSWLTVLLDYCIFFSVELVPSGCIMQETVTTSFRVNNLAYLELLYFLLQPCIHLMLNLCTCIDVNNALQLSAVWSCTKHINLLDVWVMREECWRYLSYVIFILLWCCISPACWLQLCKSLIGFFTKERRLRNSDLVHKTPEQMVASRRPK